MITEVTTITKIFTKYAKSNPGYYFLSVVFFPITLMVPLFFLVGESNRIDIFIGSTICTTTIMTIADISDIISHDKYAKSVCFFITRPVKPYHYILGVGLSTLFYNLIGVCVVFLAGAFLMSFQISILQLIIVFILVILGWFISCSLGFAVGMWGPKDPRTNTSIASILGYSLTFLAPAYYPIEYLPRFLQSISKVFYTTNLALIGKATLGKGSINATSMIVIAAYIAASFIFLFVLAQWNTD